jgi:hypothetical protein
MPRRKISTASRIDATEINDFESRAAKTKALATSGSRIELWLDQIEEKANSVLAPLTKSLPEREKALAEAREKYAAARATAATTNTAVNRKMARRALKAFLNASNALYPKFWPLATSALRNATLVREKLRQGVADEAVEAALRAVHAAWELDEAVLEKHHRAGIKGHSSWSSGGRKRAKLVKEALRPRNEAMADDFKAMRGAGMSLPECVSALHERHGLSKRQIKRILERMDMY